LIIIKLTSQNLTEKQGKPERKQKERQETKEQPDYTCQLL